MFTATTTQRGVLRAHGEHRGAHLPPVPRTLRQPPHDGDDSSLLPPDLQRLPAAAPQLPSLSAAPRGSCAARYESPAQLRVHRCQVGCHTWPDNALQPVVRHIADGQRIGGTALSAWLADGTRSQPDDSVGALLRHGSVAGRRIDKWLWIGIGLGTWRSPRNWVQRPEAGTAPGDVAGAACQPTARLPCPGGRHLDSPATGVL